MAFIIFFLLLKIFKKVEKTGIISTKFSFRCTPSVILGFQPSFSRFHEFTNSAKGNQSDKDRNDWWEKKPYSVNSATNELENTFSIISIVEFNAGFITYFWAHHRTKATNETFFKMTIFARYKYLLWCYESRIWVLCICDLWIFGHGILGWVSSTLFSFPFSPLVLVCSSFAKD